ncbi:hypothetical protein ACTJJ0_27945 [Chitinophaga sp. 22321]|uniref:Uncharacterized protein n=1 Tax=Chitinophaga hostae TaxID=2831022 RepID=A0ABS5J6Q7_9BACT|nr:hypothetical protein [Chitinophaga hostae]MBS0030905.1 hypothetical protein [Chitinophaga hostae]
MAWPAPGAGNTAINSVALSMMTIPRKKAKQAAPPPPGSTALMPSQIYL